jgi:light-regulated signal transduction histidine kinase (bacteriophytochrome)
VDNLRSYTRAGQAALTRQPVDLAEVVDDVRAGLRLLLVERRAQLRVGPLPVVPGDRTLLGLVLQNVVVNALTFNSSAAPVVEISAERTGGRWAVRISDDGIGLDLDECESVFGLFTRLHTREEYPGTGLGLAIAKRIIERHDGAIALAPRPGGGTTVTLTLPALETPA